MKKYKKIPQFKNEKEEKVFWENNDSSEYIDWSDAKSVELPNLKPSTRTISLRLSESLYNRIKIAAHKRDIPYQSYVKVILDEQVR